MSIKQDIREMGIKVAKQVGFCDEELFELIKTSSWDSVFEKAIKIDSEKTKKRIVYSWIIYCCRG